MLPLLFDVHVEVTVKKVKVKFLSGLKMQGEHITVIIFAGDTDLLAEKWRNLGVYKMD